MIDKCECGKPARHTIFENGEQKRLCCTCYIQAGNIPADWHPECMREAGKEKETVIWQEEGDIRHSSLI